MLYRRSLCATLLSCVLELPKGGSLLVGRIIVDPGSRRAGNLADQGGLCEGFA